MCVYVCVCVCTRTCVVHVYVFGLGNVARKWPNNFYMGQLSETFDVYFWLHMFDLNVGLGQLFL